MDSNCIDSVEHLEVRSDVTFSIKGELDWASAAEITSPILDFVDFIRTTPWSGKLRLTATFTHEE